MQYAVSLPNRKKQWPSLDFRTYGTCNSLPFLQVSGPSSVQAILNLIDFSLVGRVLADHETPNDPHFPQTRLYKQYGFQISGKMHLPKRC